MAKKNPHFLRRRRRRRTPVLRTQTHRRRPPLISPVIAIENQTEPGWGDWPNKTKDDRLIYLEHLIYEKYTFNKAMWPGGVTTEPLLKNPKARGHGHGNKKLTRVKQSLKPKPTIKKETSSRKQRRISSYFTRSNVNTFTN
ncbi:unnamed protein product [Brassica napus]|uniref:(rape) hypothetical protein n=1 Tax=Brassica napus TaxID=3708 RepID=A0A816TK31_BRANA|nr:unnamed protein product [Brassica napus]